MAVFLTQSGAEIYYETHGQGRPLIFTNGLLGCPAVWKQYAVEHLQTEFQCVLYSLRGQDFTRMNGAFSFDELVQDLKELIEHLGLNKVNIVADAFGGRIALSLAHDYPDCVHKMVLGSPSSLKDYNLLFKMKSWVSVLEKTDVETLYDVIFPDLYTSEFIEQNLARYESMKQLLIAGKAKNDLLLLMRSALGKSTPRSMEKVMQPTLILHGKHDAITSKAHGRHLHTLLHNSIYEELDSGHVAMAEKNEGYLEKIKRFLNS